MAEYGRVDRNIQHASLYKIELLSLMVTYLLLSLMVTALENVSEDEDINRGWENIKEYIKTSATASLGVHEMKQYKT